MTEVSKQWLVLCDYSWMFRQYLHVFDKLSIVDPVTGKEVKTGVVYGFTKFIEASTLFYRKLGINLRFIFCYDSKSTERKDLFEGYKANRPSSSLNKDVLFDDMAKVFSICSLAKNVAFASLDNKEADDIIAMLAIKNIEKFDSVLIYSGDKDFLQLTSIPKIFVATKRDKGHFCIYTDAEIQEKFDGCAKDWILPFRAITGDKSDNINPVVPRIPKKVAIQFAELLFKNDNLLPKPEAVSFDEKTLNWYLKLFESRSLYYRNYDLMSLLKYKDPNLNRSVNVFKSYTNVLSLVELFKLENWNIFVTKLQ